MNTKVIPFFVCQILLNIIKWLLTIDHKDPSHQQLKFYMNHVRINSVYYPTDIIKTTL